MEYKQAYKLIIPGNVSSPTQSFQSINMGLFGPPYLLLDKTPVFAVPYSQNPNLIKVKVNII